jgi:hypothetical protein
MVLVEAITEPGSEGTPSPTLIVTTEPRLLSRPL